MFVRQDLPNLLLVNWSLNNKISHHCMRLCQIKLDPSYLPLLDQRADLVGGHVHSVEVGQAVLARDIQHLELDLPVVLILVLVKVSKVHLKDAPLQVVGGDTHTRAVAHEKLEKIEACHHTAAWEVEPHR